MRRSEKVNRHRHVTSERTSLWSMRAKRPFSSGLKKSDSLSRNLNQPSTFFSVNIFSWNPMGVNWPLEQIALNETRQFGKILRVQVQPWRVSLTLTRSPSEDVKSNPNSTFCNLHSVMHSYHEWIYRYSLPITTGGQWTIFACSKWLTGSSRGVIAVRRIDSEVAIGANVK